MNAGPFLPHPDFTMRFSMAGDDCSLHFNLDELTPKQQADHYSNQVLTGMLQVALLYIADRGDQVCLYNTFATPPWSDVLIRYHEMFSRMGLDPLPLERIQYHPMDDYYASVAATPTKVQLENLYMVSGSNAPLHKSDQALQTSQDLNSKLHFAKHAPDFGLAVPETFITTKAGLGSAQTKAFFAKHTAPLMLKILGLAGARNVTQVATLDEAADYVAEFSDDLDIILQERLDTDDYQEMTVDIHVSEQDIHITNTRQILLADGLWVGNLMGSAVSLPPEHEAALLQVGEYARSHGFVGNPGWNLGVDYFVRKPGADTALSSLIVTEINARWTGGLFPAELVKRLGVSDQPVVAFIDMCPPDALDQYLDFVSDNLPTNSATDFAIAPMGIAPYLMEMDDFEFYFVWQIVIGDFAAFRTAKQRALPAGALPTVELIEL